MGCSCLLPNLARCLEHGIWDLEETRRIAFQGAIQDFLQSPHCAVNRLQHVCSSGRAQLCANHVQHIECLSRATCRVTCHVV